MGVLLRYDTAADNGTGSYRPPPFDFWDAVIGVVVWSLLLGWAHHCAFGA